MGATSLRVGAVWLVSTLTMLVLAGVLPDFRLQSAGGDSATVIGITAAAGAGAFGLLSALVWPLLVRAFLLVPALVLGLLVFFLNGSLLWLALSLIPYGRGSADPSMAVVVAAVMSAASSATNAFLAVRDDRVYRHRLARIAGRRRRREGRGTLPGTPGTPGTVFLQLDGLGYAVLKEALEAPEGGEPLMPALAALYGSSHRLTRWRTDWSSQTGASQLGILHGSNEDVPAFRWYEKETGETVVSNRPTSAAELQRRAGRTASGSEARMAARAALRRPEESGQEAPRKPRRDTGPVVLASGNLALISFPDHPGRLTREHIDELRPALLPTLAEHPGIGFVLVHSAEHGPVVLGAGGCERRLETGEVVGARDPLAPFGPGAAEAVLRTARFPHAADIMVNSALDPETGTVHAFEEQIGSHGGLGGEQSEAFLLSPLELSPPVGPGEELVGAEAVHRVLRRWLAESAEPHILGGADHLAAPVPVPAPADQPLVPRV
ncbi:phage holin family protein [Streptomyces oryzae]|uniref:Phage holin family protein n=1 Tax=Streptomyces oryzae TaxID=1434886 RepID=A0ABS3XFF7_9ACTN|nr:phage holin family protein [Streptomyces oryzae]